MGEATALVVADIDLSSGEESLVVRQQQDSLPVRRTIPVVPVLRDAHSMPGCSVMDGGRAPTAPTRHCSARAMATSMKASYIWRVVKRLAFRAGRSGNSVCVPSPCSRGRHEQGCPRSQNGENLSSVSPHTLRRTFGSDLLNRGFETRGRVQVAGSCIDNRYGASLRRDAL